MSDAAEKRRVILAIGNSLDKELSSRLRDLRCDVYEDLVEENDGRKNVKGVGIGNVEVTIGVYPSQQTTAIVGYGEEFTEFMREHGMTHEVINDGWEQCVVQMGGKIVWEETGEVVPGAYLQVQDNKPKMRISIPRGMTHNEVLFEASQAGLLDVATMPLLIEGD